MQFALRVLGNLEFMIDGTLVESFPTNKARALLVYLALESNQTNNREFPRRLLANLFWPEIADKYALQNLRNTLYYVRQTLDAVAASEHLLKVTRRSFWFTSTDVAIDVVDFQTSVNAVSVHTHASLAGCATCLDRLTHSIKLYQGELLAGFHLSDAPAFEEWLLLRREQLHQQAIWVASSLAEAHESLDDLELSLQYAHRLIELDPYQENGHRCLMRVAAKQGSSSQAFAHYEKLRQLLQDELGCEPSQETQALAEQIRRGEFEKIEGRQEDKTTR